MAAILRYRRRRQMRRQRIFRDRKNPMDLYDDEELYDKFRFRRHDILEICDEINDAVEHETGRGGALPVVLQVCLALRFFATGTFQDTVGELIGVTQSTVSRNVQRVMDALITLLPQYVGPPTPEEVQRSKIGFQQMAGFPGIIGCIDGTHVRIQAPRVDEDVYVNRKNYHSINVQILCNHELIIMDCTARSPGSFHDARILRESPLFRGMEHQPRRVDGIILGDSGYPIREWLLTPFANPARGPQERYNDSHKSTRTTVERCIGVLKRRWHCLHTELRMQPARCSRVIYCCVILHNKATALNLPPPGDDNDQNPQPPRPPPPPPTPNDHAATVAGQAARDRITRNHF